MSDEVLASYRGNPAYRSIAQGKRPGQGIARDIQEESRRLRIQVGCSSTLMSPLDHPVIKWATVIFLVVSIAGVGIGLYIFFEHLDQGLAAKKVLDEKWLDLDIEGHQNILDQCKAAQVEVKLLAAKLEGDWRLPALSARLKGRRGALQKSGGIDVEPGTRS